MYSPEFMRFLVGRDANDFISNEKKSETKQTGDSLIYRYTKLATVPIEIKK